MNNEEFSEALFSRLDFMAESLRVLHVVFEPNTSTSRLVGYMRDEIEGLTVDLSNHMVALSKDEDA